jgi:hypothetical protein
MFATRLYTQNAESRLIVLASASTAYGTAATQTSGVRLPTRRPARAQPAAGLQESASTMSRRNHPPAHTPASRHTHQRTRSRVLPGPVGERARNPRDPAVQRHAHSSRRARWRPQPRVRPPARWRRQHGCGALPPRAQCAVAPSFVRSFGCFAKLPALDESSGANHRIARSGGGSVAPAGRPVRLQQRTALAGDIAAWCGMWV